MPGSRDSGPAGTGATTGPASSAAPISAAPAASPGIHGERVARDPVRTETVPDLPQQGGALSRAQADALLRPGESPRLVLDDAGRAPRAVLRYDHVGHTGFELTWSATLGAKAASGDAAAPSTPLRGFAHLHRRDYDPSDDRCRVILTLFGPARAAELSAAQAVLGSDDTLRYVLLGQGRAVHFALLDPRGQAVSTLAQDTSLSRWDDLDGWVARLAAESTMLDGVPPLPAAPLGTGARWRVLTRGDRPDAPAIRHRTYTLEAARATHVDLGVELHELPIATRAQQPDSPPLVERRARHHLRLRRPQLALLRGRGEWTFVVHRHSGSATAAPDTPAALAPARVVFARGPGAVPGPGWPGGLPLPCTLPDGTPGQRSSDRAPCLNPCLPGMAVDPDGRFCAKKCTAAGQCPGGSCPSTGVCDRWPPELDCANTDSCATPTGAAGRRCRAGGPCVPSCKPGLVLSGGTHCVKRCRSNAQCVGGLCLRDRCKGHGTLPDCPREPVGICWPLCPSEGCPYLWE